jgi:hypothetical protein
MHFQAAKAPHFRCPLRSEKGMPYVKTLFSVCDIVLVTTPLVGYSRNSEKKFFTKQNTIRHT